MVKEAYCSFEVANLLKEKGFDESVLGYYNIWDSKINPPVWDVNTYRRSEAQHLYIKAPTHQLACAWVRKKGYSVEVHATAVGWHWEVCKINGTSIAFGGNVPSDKTNDGGAYDDYDECMDNALMYTLTNLI